MPCLPSALRAETTQRWGWALHLVPPTHAGDQEEEAGVQPRLPLHSSPPCGSGLAAQPWFHIQASLFSDALRKTPADAGGDGITAQQLRRAVLRGVTLPCEGLRRTLAPPSHAKPLRRALRPQQGSPVLQAVHAAGKTEIKIYIARRTTFELADYIKVKMFSLIIRICEWFFFPPPPAAREGEQEGPRQRSVAAPHRSRSAGRTTTRRFHELQHYPESELCQ